MSTRLGIALLLAAAACGCDSGERLRIESADGAVVLDVEIERAETPDERVRGLRGSALGPNEGLLIVLPGSSEVCIENAGVSFSIDAVFLSEALDVSHVERGIPADDSTQRCHLASFVLEVAAGTAAGAAVGDRASVH